MSFVATESRMPSLVRERVESYRNALVALMQDSRLLDDQVEADWLGAQGRQFEDGYQATKQFVLSAASRGDLKHLAYLDDAMREADLMRRIAHHVVRSAARFKAARDALTMPESSSSTADVNVADEVIRNE